MKIRPILLLLLFCHLTYSQADSHKFNLNFETFNPEKELPAGWFKWGIYELEVDTLEADRGNVLKIISDEEGSKYGSVAYHIPANYVGDSIQLSGYMKLEDVSGESTAGLLLRINGKGERNVLAFDNMHSRQINGTRDWKKYSITLPFPADSEEIYVAGILSGKGKAWFDDFQVSIDGKDIQTLKEIKKPDLVLDKKAKKQLKRLFRKSHIAVDLKTEQALNESLDHLVEQLGDKKIVAIGEDTHGTSEYYRLRKALTKKLIIEKGFNTIILENPYDDIEVMTRDWNDTNLDTLMRRHLFPIYQTSEMKSFLQWLHSYGNEVRFKGSDDSYWVLTETMKEKIRKLEDPEISRIFNQLDEAAMLGFEDFNKKHPDLAVKPKNDYELGALAYAWVTELEEKLLSHGLLDDELKEQIFHLKTTYVNYDNLKNSKPITTRDEVMAQRISEFAKDPEAKIIVWAHNAHISNSVVIGDEIGKMGANLRKEFGEAYHSIGMSSLDGSYSFIENRFVNGDHEYDDDLLQSQLQHRPSSSWEALFAEVKTEDYYLELSNLKSKTKDLEGIDNLRLLGYSLESENDYYQLSPFRLFDTLFFIKQSTATKPLFN